MHLMWVMQAHHIDTDDYDKFFGPGDYGPAHAAHMANWLRGGRPHAYRRVMQVATRGSASVEDHGSVGAILMFNTGLLHGERVGELSRGPIACRI